MTLVLLDGCEDLSSWTVSSVPSIVAGRNGNCWSLSSSQILKYDLLAADESEYVMVGFAVKNTGSSWGGGTILDLYGDAGTTAHISIRPTTNTATTGFTALRYPGSILGTSAAGLLTLNNWYYVEAYLRLHDTLGSVRVLLNGVQVLNLTNVDTRNAGTKTVLDQVRVVNSGVNNLLIDDLYVKTGAGESFLGEIVVESLYPVGNGNANQWTPVGAAVGSNWQAVDEVSSSLTDFVYSKTATERELYAMSDLVGTGTIVGVCHSALMLNTDTATSRSIKVVNRRTTDTKSAAMVLSSSAYRTYDYSLTVDPETGAPWTVANVNALQSGVELQ